MAIFVDETTKVVYQGLTGSQGRFYGLLNRQYGTQVVAGTNPKKAGTDVEGIPVFASVAEAVAETGANASCIFIPAPGVAAAVMEAAEGGVELIVVITEGVPAHDKGLQYVGLEGSVGVIANGAGLAMSTVDIVNQVGGKPANFLDIGGGANADVMAGALEVINNDPEVKSIFINIFGGITKGDEVANGIVTAMGRVDIGVPIVIRLDGTNADEGRRILEPHLSDRLQMQPTMLEAAQTAVALAGKG
jgi:succinyl-CoA synthetase alpha subunit